MPVSQLDSIAPVDEALTLAFRESLSRPRLHVYERAAGYKPDRAIRLYLWNVAIGQSFHFPLHCLEIALRNRIAEVLLTEFGKHWWRDAQARHIFSSRSCEEIKKVVRRLRRQKAKPSTDDVVAGLSFGFWVSVLAPRYKPHIWSKHLTRAFRHLPNGTLQNQIYNLANRVLELRNRMAHHEPLLSRNLSQDYANLLQLLNWICPDTKDWVKHHCSVPSTLRKKP